MGLIHWLLGTAFFQSILQKIEQFLVWCGRAVVDSGTGQPSVKRVGLMLTVTMLVTVMGVYGGVAAGVVWTNRTGASNVNIVELVRILTTSLEILAGIVMTAVTGSYIGGKVVERKYTAPPTDPSKTPAKKDQASADPVIDGDNP